MDRNLQDPGTDRFDAQPFKQWIGRSLTKGENRATSMGLPV
ncbi:hypothetical protein [Bradyrhizobium sp.]